VDEHLITTMQPLLIADHVQERLSEMGLEMKAVEMERVPTSWLGVPMVIGDRRVGTMVVLSHTTPRAYDGRCQEALGSVASQTAIALQNVRLLEETQAALAEVEATHRSYLRRAWQEHVRQREVLDKSSYLYDRLQEHLGGEVVVQSEVRRPEIEKVVAEGRPSAARGGDDGQERAGLAVPITLRGQLLGVIGVEAPAGKTEWSEDEIALVQAVGEQLGQALESARLFADTQRRAERERLVGEIAAKIRSSTDLQAILETTAVELGQLLGTSRARVRLAAEGPVSGRSRERPQVEEPLDASGEVADASDAEANSHSEDAGQAAR
jgi:GAF domain-containing protein